jgi:hypothetical protein
VSEWLSRFPEFDWRCGVLDKRLAFRLFNRPQRSVAADKTGINEIMAKTGEDDRPGRLLAMN